jgi:hypothetical protein
MKLFVFISIDKNMLKYINEYLISIKYCLQLYYLVCEKNTGHICCYDNNILA